MTDHPLASLHQLVWIALAAALLAVGAYVHIPLGPVPVSLQTFFVLMIGFILGPARGALGVSLYITAGLLGLPVFSAGQAGLAHVVGPTGGYLLGFIPAAAIAGLATYRKDSPLPWLKGLGLGLLSFIILYAIGLAWLKIALGITWSKALTVGLIPFIPGDIVKLCLAVVIYRYIAAHRMIPF